MAEPAFQHYQYAFTAHLRDPLQPVPDGVAPERIEVYAELLFNNLRGFIDVCCPISREIVAEPRWTALIRTFYVQHRCHSPLFRDIPREFVHWLLLQPLSELPPFIAHLAHYEWLELAADVHAAPVPATRAVADILTAALHANPTLQLGIYPWPVHRIGPEFQPDAPDATPTCLAVYRDQHDMVRFTQLNPLSAHLLQLLQAEPTTGQAALQQLASAAGMRAEQLQPFACDLLQQWLDEQLLHAPD
ncbi:MAG: putative DNA-binding domain-containing protein [Chitinivorax sp.]